MKNIFKVEEEFNLFLFLLSLIITLGVGFLSASIVSGSTALYEFYKKPIFAPPSWIFKFVWTILYFLMSIALYRIWVIIKKNNDDLKPLILYFIQLSLNFLWPIIFFRLRLSAIAFLELIILIVFILITTIEFYKKDKIAGDLMLPYLLWSIFAAVLNYSIWLLNA